MTIALENLSDGSVSDRNFQALMRLVLDTGGKTVGIRFGAATLTWAGGTQFSNGLTVTHGLGKTPIGVLATANLGTLAGVAAWATTPGATTFTLQGWDPAGSPGAGATDKVFWVVIG